MQDLADQLEKLARLNAEGALSNDEFARAKAQLLSGQTSSRMGGALSRLFRSRSERWIGGVAGGLAVATDLPVWAWRVLFVLLALLHGIGVVMYVLMWIFVPLEAEFSAAPSPINPPDAA